MGVLLFVWGRRAARRSTVEAVKDYPRQHPSQEVSDDRYRRYERGGTSIAGFRSKKL